MVLLPSLVKIRSLTFFILKVMIFRICSQWSGWKVSVAMSLASFITWRSLVVFCRNYWISYKA